MLLFSRGVLQFFSCETNLSVPLYRLRSETYFLRGESSNYKFQEVSERFLIISPPLGGTTFKMGVGRADGVISLGRITKKGKDFLPNHP